MDPRTAAFTAELEKLAAEAVSSRSVLATKLQPGDIIISSSDKPSAKASKVERVGGGVFSAISRSRYGDTAHASIYTGDGKAVQMFEKLHVVPFSVVVKNRDAKVFRPTASRKDRALAASRALAFVDAIGDRAEYAKPLWLLKLLAADTKTLSPLVKKEHDSEIKEDRVICSNTVSMAYKGIVDFHHDKPHGYITPSDLATSKKVTEVATYYNPRRWDPKRRMWGKP